MLSKPANLILTQNLNNAVKLLVSSLIHNRNQHLNDGVCLVKGAGKSTPPGGHKKPKAQRKEKVRTLYFRQDVLTYELSVIGGGHVWSYCKKSCPGTARVGLTAT